MTGGKELSSALAPHIEGLVARKHALGVSYAAPAEALVRIDRLCVSENLDCPVVTRELAAAWAEAVPGEVAGSRACRMSALRQLAKYERSIGLDAYVPGPCPAHGRSVVYLPTPEETRALFAEADAHAGDPRWPHMAGGPRVAFRLMRFCGMRVSECSVMAAADVDAGAGTLLVRSSKGGRDRIVYMTGDMADLVRRHMLETRRTLGFSPDWLFPGRDPARHVSSLTLQRRFAALWARVPGAAGKSLHPTPHSLRHAFVVDRMNRWMEEGVSLWQMMPYLASYLGHSSADETFYYYHQVAEAGRIVRGRDDVSSRVIPEAVPHEE